MKYYKFEGNRHHDDYTTSIILEENADGTPKRAVNLNGVGAFSPEQYESLKDRHVLTEASASERTDQDAVLGPFTPAELEIQNAAPDNTTPKK